MALGLARMLGAAQQWRLAAQYARCEARAGFSGFRVFLLCLALGVGAIAAVGLMASAFQQGLVVEGRSILGGDVELTLTQRKAGLQELQFLKSQGTLSEVSSLRAMAHRVDGVSSALIDIKAIDQAYPLVGKMGFASKSYSLDDLRTSNTAAVDPILLGRLDLKLGDEIKIGDARFRIAAVIEAEPDRITTGLTFGPRVMLSKEALAVTNLVQPGSLVRWRYRLRFEVTKDATDRPEAFRVAANAAFPDAGWRIRDRSNSAPRIKRFVDRLAMLLTFVALTTLVVGGVGIGTATKTYLDGRVKTIAMLKCLGAPGGFIFKLYLILLLRLVILGSVVGLILGLLLTVGLGPMLQTLVPLPAKFAFYWQPLAVAGLYGLLVTLMFALWSLGSARAVPAAALFRAHIATLPAWPAAQYMIATVVLLAVLVALTFWLVLDPRFAVIYTGGVIGSFILFWGIAKLIVWGARKGTHVKLRLVRLALIQLRGAGLTTTSTVISLGLGLTLLVSLALIEGNFVRHLVKELPKTAPSFFFVDIQRDQLASLEEIVQKTKSVTKFDRVPMLRGRIMRLNGIDAEKIKAPPSVQWVLQGDRGITYAAAKPDEITLTQGKWWSTNYDGPPLVSFAQDIASGLGLKIGDEVTVNVLGREITAKIANLRHVEWGSLGINFVMLFSPNPVSQAPHNYLATLAMAKTDETRLMRQVAGKFANITMINVREILQSVNSLMEKLLFAAYVAAGLALFVGVIVLVGALASSQRARRYDAVILKTLGFTRPQLLRVYALEHGFLGIVTGVISAVCGSIIAFCLLEFVFHVPWNFLGFAVVITVIGAVFTTITLGLGGTWRVLGVRPARILHNE